MVLTLETERRSLHVVVGFHVSTAMKTCSEVAKSLSAVRLDAVADSFNK